MEDQKENCKMPILGFFMSIKHLRFPVVIKWKVLSHYAKKRSCESEILTPPLPQAYKIALSTPNQNNVVPLLIYQSTN